MNAYEKRRLRANLRRKSHEESSRAYKYAEIDWRCRRYERNMLDWAGVAVTVTYKNGWYWVSHHAYRAGELDNLSNQLEVRIHIRDNPPPEEDDG